MKTKGRLILRVNSSNDYMLSETGCPNQKRLHESGPDSSAAAIGPNVHRMFDSEPIARPGAKITERREADDMALIGRDEHWIALRDTSSPPRDTIVERRRLLGVDGSRCGDDVVIDRQKIRQVVDTRISDLHTD